MSSVCLLLVLLPLCRSAALGAPSPDVMEVRSGSGSDSALDCTARHVPRVQYLSVRWYKVGPPPTSLRYGLLVRDLPNGTTQWFHGVIRQVALLGASHTIVLPNVTCSDSGMYVCFLAAPVGERNQEGRVLLTLTDCSDRPDELLTDAYLVMFASVVLIGGLFIFRTSYGMLKKMLKEKNKVTEKTIRLDAPLMPLKEEDLILIATLGLKPSLKSMMKHIQL